MPDGAHDPCAGADTATASIGPGSASTSPSQDRPSGNLSCRLRIELRPAAAWRKANERLRHLRVRRVSDATGLARREYPIALAEVKPAYAAMTGQGTAAPGI